MLCFACGYIILLLNFLEFRKAETKLVLQASKSDRGQLEATNVIWIKWFDCVAFWFGYFDLRPFRFSFDFFLQT